MDHPVFSKLFPARQNASQMLRPFPPMMSPRPDTMHHLAMLLCNSNISSPDRQPLHHHHQGLPAELQHLHHQQQPQQHQQNQQQLSQGGAEDGHSHRDGASKRGGRRKKTFWKVRRAVTPPPEPAAPAVSVKKIVSSTNAPEGGKIVSSRDEKGHITMRVEYDREQMLHCARSPYALLPPEALRTIVTELPEILSRFPVRHGVARPIPYDCM